MNNFRKYWIQLVRKLEEWGVAAAWAIRRQHLLIFKIKKMTAKEYLKDVGLIQRNSVFKCKDVELQPIECETYKNCKS